MIRLISPYHSYFLVVSLENRRLTVKEIFSRLKVMWEDINLRLVPFPCTMVTSQIMVMNEGYAFSPDSLKEIYGGSVDQNGERYSSISLMGVMTPNTYTTVGNEIFIHDRFIANIEGKEVVVRNNTTETIQVRQGVDYEGSPYSVIVPVCWTIPEPEYEPFKLSECTNLTNIPHQIFDSNPKDEKPKEISDRMKKLKKYRK